VFVGKSRRTKKSATAVSLINLWRGEEQAAFKDLQAAIIESMAWAFPTQARGSVHLTDFSERFCDGLVTQIHEEQLNLPMQEQYHHYHTLVFLRGDFKGAQQ
jgi:hypothetical protein